MGIIAGQSIGEPFPLEEWDFAIETMDLNPPFNQTNTMAPTVQELPAPEVYIKRRKKRAWRLTGILSHHLRNFEEKAKKASAQELFDLNLPPGEDLNLTSSGKPKRLKLQKKTKGKATLKFGLSDEDKPDGSTSDAGSSLSSSTKDHPADKEILKDAKTQGAADQQPQVSK